MKLVDLGGTLKHHIWERVTPLPLVEVTELVLPANSPYPVYAQAVSMPMQASTYLETAAHLYPERIMIADLPLERLFTEAVVVNIPLGPRGAITGQGLKEALLATGAVFRKGDSLLVATGWDAHWEQPNYASESPYFTAEAIDWILSREPGILGSDAARWDNGQQGFFPKFFESETLLLAPLVNLTALSKSRVQLITLPLKLAGVCAAQCRVIAIED